MAARNKTSVDDAVPEALSNKELTTKRQFSDDDLREITSFEDAMKLVATTYGGVTNIDELELGNGFKVVGDGGKERLIETPFLIVSFTFNEGDFGEFVSLMVVTQYGDRLILNDGSTGIYAQLLDVMKTTDKFGGIMVPAGLRKSEYQTCVECGRPRKPSTVTCECGDGSERRAKGATFYLDVS